MGVISKVIIKKASIKMDAFPRSIESKIPAAYCFFNSFLIFSPFEL